MKLKELDYEVKAVVEFTKEEAEYLADRAKRHYDYVCNQAGCAIGEMGARVNGFIAQLVLFPGKPHVWRFRDC